MTRVTVEQVQSALALARPGFEAQLRLSPRPRTGALPPPPPERPKREAGVLILLYPRDGELYFPLTLRTLSVATHKGQVSLPGGAREPGEELVETARRETSEELGLAPDGLHILGLPLTPLYIPVSGFWVTAFVGCWHGLPLFHPAPDEVIELIETPLSALLDDSFVVEEEWEIRNEHVHVPFFQIGRHRVWGATAMMLSEFKTLLEAQIALQGNT